LKAQNERASQRALPCIEACAQLPPRPLAQVCGATELMNTVRVRTPETARGRRMTLWRRGRSFVHKQTDFRFEWMSFAKFWFPEKKDPETTMKE
jgi:hypothetical protein